jgi:anti-sigma-K factor RskA
MIEFSASELSDMAPAYVLGALSSDELAVFDAALASSPELLREVAEFRAVLERIGTEHSVTPPPALRVRFLEQIASTRDASGAATPAAPVAPAPGITAPPALIVSSGGRAATRSNGGARWMLPAALTFALAASLFFAVKRNGDVQSLNATVAARDSIIRARDIALGQRDSTLNTMLGANRDLVLVNLGTAPTNGPGMQFFWNVKEGRGVIHAFNLKPAGPGRTYQLWLIKDGKPVPSKLFNSSANGDGVVWDIELPKDTKGVSAVAVTEEPASGSPAPTSTPFLVGAVGKAIQ